jgi:diadenosine tetraphosphate (Ap4A) HIT family hydrolase
MASGWLVAGEVQVVSGYCLLLPDPVVPHLNSLVGEARAQFLVDMARAGDALLKVTGAARINYEMLGNLEPALHCHLFPRRSDEPESVRFKPVWSHDWDAAPRWDLNADATWMVSVRQEIK